MLIPLVVDTDPPQNLQPLNVPGGRTQSYYAALLQAQRAAAAEETFNALSGTPMGAEPGVHQNPLAIPSTAPANAQQFDANRKPSANPPGVVSSGNPMGL